MMSTTEMMSTTTVQHPQTMTKHHPGIDRLTAFSAGSLPFNQALCISAHLQYCPQCRQAVKRLNQVGSELFSELPTVTVTDTLKERVMAQLDAPAAPELTEPQSAVDGRAENNAGSTAANSNVPRCLQKLIPNGLDALRWKRLSPSIYATKLCRDVDGSKVEMLRIKPGGQVAAHNHTGEEVTLVLQGSFSDSEGVYNQGDIIYRNKDDKHHRPLASQDAECICLTSVQAPIQFTGFFARLFNPFIRRSHYAS
ncbi:ChrR family anti-sigma-E factor [Pseudomaricurvus sp.]|uniref:ChrR family anti-sigma-E factor n=1 Tax=Pseudomaricurvus sp. TaxID=2004510 RepID=UPI003F6AD6F0